MLKKDGTLFSSALFGYKKSDVNDYIRLSDKSHSDQLSLLQAENERLLERAKEAEAKIEDLEKTIIGMETEFNSRIESLTVEYEKELKKAAETASGAGKHNKPAHNHAGIRGMFKKK